MAKMQAFLSLEKSTASTMHAVWKPVARKAMEKIYPLLEQKRWDEAYDIVDRLTMFGVVETHRRRLEELAVSCLLFGAHNVTGKVQSTSFVRGTREVPYALQQALDQLTLMIETGGGEMVRQRLQALIHAEEIRPEAEPVEKADRPSNVIPLWKAEMSLADMLNEAVMGTGTMAIDIGANLTTSRLVTLGFLGEATENQIDTYQVNEVLDSRTCPVCEYMHGKTFRVEQEFSRVMSALATQDPKELRSIAPWPSTSKAGMASLRSMSLEEMQAAGYGSPPFHPGCRGVLAMTGTVVELHPVKIPEQLLNELIDGTKQAPAEPAVADVSEFTPVSEEAALDVRKKLASNPGNDDILEKYTTNRYGVINSVLRNGEDRSEWSDSLASMIDGMDALFLKGGNKLVDDVLLYRGIGNAEDVFGTDLSAMIGMVVEDKAYMSTSTALGTAARFIEGYTGDVTGGRALLKIRAPKGTAAVAGDPRELEVILNRGQKLRVVGAKYETKTVNGENRKILHVEVEFAEEAPPQAVAAVADDLPAALMSIPNDKLLKLIEALPDEADFNEALGAFADNDYAKVQAVLMRNGLL